MDLNQFSKRIEEIAVETEEEVGKTVRKVALAADQAVVTATPVDTGRARSNWLVRVGLAAREIIDPYAPGTKGSTGAANIQAALDQAAAVIAGYKAGETAPIYISNNLPYIEKLNQGWSKQAPANFVELGVQAGVALVRNAKVVRD